MEKLIGFLPIVAAVVGGWALLNGILHDIFVIINHKKQYDRELLRLLMDGHILITCGIIQLIAYIGLRENASWGFWVAGVASVSLLVYCGMIFPFLKSFGTIFLNLSLLILVIMAFFKQ